LHIPRPGNRGGEFVATFPSVPCNGCGLAFPLRVGSRRVSVSGPEVKAGEKVVGATPGVWLLGSGVASRSGGGINVTFLRPHEPQLSAMRCVTLNQIDLSYMICVRSFVVLCPHYSTLSSPLPFCYDKISRKGRVFRSFP